MFSGILLVSLGSNAQVRGTDTEAGNDFTLLHDLTKVSVKDSRDRIWDGGYYTQNPTVRVSYECDNTEINSVRFAVLRCNGIIRADYTYYYSVDAVEKNLSDIDIIDIANGETAEFDVSVPGRYSLAYCVTDKEEKTILKKSIEFDSLYDDGLWKVCGEAEVSSGILDSAQTISHHFQSNGIGFLEEPGDFIWWECPITYPYYSGETWEATIEYHLILRMYRIVNPFTQNTTFRDYIPEDNELLCTYHSNVAYTPEAFLFDRENPSWFLLNAEWEHFTYCEPMRTGLIAQHVYSSYCFIAHPYNEMIGYVKYDVCPAQDIKTTGVYVDMPLADENEASLKIKFQGWISGINEVFHDKYSKTEYFTIEGLKVSHPDKGFYIVRQKGKSSKIIY